MRSLTRVIKKNLGVIIVTFIAIVLIIYIEYITWKPLYSTYADSINHIIEGLSLSILATFIFYFFNILLPQYSMWEIASQSIDYYINAIRESLRLLTCILSPFTLIPKQYDAETFKMDFSKFDLNESFMGGSQKRLDYINFHKYSIKRYCDTLMTEYAVYMTDTELQYIRQIAFSYFVSSPIIPMDFSIPIETRIFYPNNQEKMGESIFALYCLKRP